jgi:hypothetical protein
MLRRRHRVTAWLVAGVFLGSLGVGALYGVASGYQHQQALKVLHDFAVARIFESNIDAAENRVMGSPEDYADVCATLTLLASEWQTHLDELSADATELQRVQLLQKPEFRKEMKGLQEIVMLDRRKLLLIQQQIALNKEAKSIDPEKKQAFWHSQFPPLRQQIRGLDREKDQMAKTLLAGR